MDCISNKLRYSQRHPAALDDLHAHLKNVLVVPDAPVAWGERRIPLSRARHHGGYVSTFPGQPLLRFESELERQVLRFLASRQECMALATQPVTFWFPFNGQMRRYTPDILVVMKIVPQDWVDIGLERIALIEVKPPRFRKLDPVLWAARCLVAKRALDMPLIRFPMPEEK